ncbi:MAG TPA: amidohydrolase family protein [Candidatus Eisenbacteria bacterium]|nr:amidohydrolase family protein [Candidatus Eisenbacteria bacterium]
MGSFQTPISRRRALQIGAAVPFAVLAACNEPPRSSESPTQALGSPSATLAPTPSSSAVPTATAQAAATLAPPARVLYRDAALADGRSASLQRGISILVEGGRVSWIRPRSGEEDPGDAEIVDASGATIVPGMVDAHSHVTNPGGAHWIERFADRPERLVAYAEANAQLAWNAGIRWFRDVGSPTRPDPVDGRDRALAIGLRDRWRGRPGYPAIRAAGTWITRPGTLPAGLTLEARNADELLGFALRQLDDGADLVKLYLDGPDASVAPWSVAEVRRVVEAVHARSAQVTAHSGILAGAHVAADAGVDAIEHGFVLDDSGAAAMAANGVKLISTLTVFRSWETFGQTTSLPFFAGERGSASIRDRLALAEVSLLAARAAGVAISAGTDFGGGSGRANQLAWEVESLVAAGLEPVEALAAATWQGGELLGEPDAGVIREGGPADFFLVHGDPLTDPAALWRVWRHA